MTFTLASSLACHGEVTAPATPAEAAGTYVLQTVIGRGPTTGEFILTADGRAERRVRYAVAAPFEHLATGTFEIDADGISFALLEAGLPMGYIWPVHGEWRGSSFTIQYPDPADGPDIVETYRRR
jgi:hypothetical protein